MVLMSGIIRSGRPKLQKTFYFCIAVSGYSAVRSLQQTNVGQGSDPGWFSGYSAVRLAHLVWDQRVVCSNHTTPT